MGRVGLYHVHGTQMPILQALTGQNRGQESSQFSVNSRSILSQFSGDSGINRFKIVHDLPTKLVKSGKIIVDSHIPHTLCPCNFAKVIRAKEMSIPSTEWFEIWEKI